MASVMASAMASAMETLVPFVLELSVALRITEAGTIEVG